MTLNWTITGIDDTDASRADWNALNSSTTKLPMQDFEFWVMLLRHFGSGNELLCVCRSGDKVVAATIVEPVRYSKWEVVAPAQAPLGAWLENASVPLGELLQSLAASLPGIVTSVGLTRLDPTFNPRPATTSTVSTLDYIVTGRIRCLDGFENYWQSRGRNLRQNLKRQRNRLVRDSVETRLVAITNSDESKESINRYGLLESAGWKGQSGTALHPENVQGAFYRDLLAHYSARGEGVIYEYHYDEKLVALDICLLRGETLTILKTTHDESQRETSPALLMRQESVREMLDNLAITNIEFYGKQMDWHTKWTDDFRTMYHVNYDRVGIVRWLRRLRAGGD